MTTREFLDAYDKITSHGWLTVDEALLLVTWAEATRGPMIEVGSYMGRSAMLLAQLKEEFNEDVHGGQRLRMRNRQLFCIDPWDDKFSSDMGGAAVFSRFQTNVRSIPGERVSWFKVRVEDAAPIQAGFTYLDGDHTFSSTVNQIEFALACNSQVIAAHDVSDSGEGAEVKRACLSLLGPWRERIGKLAVWVLL